MVTKFQIPTPDLIRSKFQAPILKHWFLFGILVIGFYLEIGISGTHLVGVGFASEEVEEGKKVYQERCMFCHGGEGKGDGPAADLLYPRPRDFTRGQYKIRSTPSGALPTDDDLFKIISEGMPGTSMPGWKDHLSNLERQQLVTTIKTFSD